jgi:hypothetical protein
MRRSAKTWTRQESDALVRLVEGGKQSPEIATILGRTVLQVRNKAKHLQLKLKRGGALPKITPEDRQAASCNALRNACLALFARTADRYKISDQEAMSCHLGFYSPPSVIRAPLKTASAERLAA